MTVSKRKPITKGKGPRASAKVKFRNVGPKLTGSQLGWAEFNLGSPKFPPDYRQFLLKYNGGSPDPALFNLHHPSEGTSSAHVDRLFGIDSGGFDRQRAVDCISIALKYRDDMPRYSLPIGFVDRDNLLLIFLCGPREGQIWIKIWGEVSPLVDRPTDREAATYFVAKSFSEFLGSLHHPTGNEAGVHLDES